MRMFRGRSTDQEKEKEKEKDRPQKKTMPRPGGGRVSRSTAPVSRAQRARSASTPRTPTSVTGSSGQSARPSSPTSSFFPPPVPRLLASPSPSNWSVLLAPPRPSQPASEYPGSVSGEFTRYLSGTRSIVSSGSSQVAASGTLVDQDKKVSGMRRKMERLNATAEESTYSVTQYKEPFVPQAVNPQFPVLYAPPQHLVDVFADFNVDIAQFCTGVAEWTLKNWPFEDDIEVPSTGDVSNLTLLKNAFPEGNAVPSMILSKRNSPRPLEDVIDYGLRSIISRALYDEILEPFHPSLSLRVGGEEGTKRSQYLKSIYYSILYDENDVSMIHWKAGTFKSLESLTGDEFQASFVDDVLRTLTDKHIMPLLQAIFGDRTNNPPIDLEPIRPVIQMAYEWNKVVKSVVPPIDFRPFVFPNAGHFNAEDMDYYEKPIKAARTRVIVCAGSIGLKLHDSECPEGRVLQKVMVLTPQNYGDN